MINNTSLTYVNQSLISIVGIVSLVICTISIISLVIDWKFIWSGRSCLILSTKYTTISGYWLVYLLNVCVYIISNDTRILVLKDQRSLNTIIDSYKARLLRLYVTITCTFRWRICNEHVDVAISGMGIGLSGYRYQLFPLVRCGLGDSVVLALLLIH